MFVFEVVFFTFGLVEKYEGKGGQFLVMAKPYCLHWTCTIPTCSHTLSAHVGHGNLLTISPSLQFCHIVHFRGYAWDYVYVMSMWLVEWNVQYVVFLKSTRVIEICPHLKQDIVKVEHWLFPKLFICNVGLVTFKFKRSRKQSMINRGYSM